jgi:hypothetical protein
VSSLDLRVPSFDVSLESCINDALAGLQFPPDQAGKSFPFP